MSVVRPFRTITRRSGSLSEARFGPARAIADNVGANGGVSVGVNETLLQLISEDPALSAAGLAARLGKSSRTIERHLAQLKADGVLRREGADKTGRWIMIEK
ncbi:MAG TPA: winged helix-turn-helix transcriptional regulator [Humibacter sp.]|nr:winged helix-turn-helix transcriptional regulator [Humibacter sp.]